MKTKALYLINRLFCSPLEAMFTILIFILGKDGGASPIQIAVIAACKPTVSLFAFYLSSAIMNRTDRIKPYLIIMTLVGCLPCLLFPFFDNPWFFVVSYALFAMTTKASFPAWSEVLRKFVGLEKMSNCVSKGTSINHALLLLLPLLVSFWMDQHPSIWKTIYSLFALLSIGNLVGISMLPSIPKSSQPLLPNFSLTFPLKEGVRVLRGKPLFAKYLIVFLLGGAGIVATQSVLPIFFKQVLNLSYTQLTLAFSFCKGIAFVSTSLLWARFINRVSLFLVNAVMSCFTFLYFACLFASSFDLVWLYLGYLLYGVMQAGSELSWNMSGPLFSQEKESTSYSSLNLIAVGLRGCICPFLGQLIFASSGVFAVFAISALVTLLNLLYGFWLNHFYKVHPLTRKA